MIRIALFIRSRISVTLIWTEAIHFTILLKHLDRIAVIFFNALALWMFILSHKLIFSYFLCVHTFHEQPDGIILVIVYFSFFKCRAPVLVRER